MGLLYEKYSSPLEFMSLYINRGRFGEFVDSILTEEYDRRVAEATKENERMLWQAYVHSFSDESFDEWKKRVLKGGSTTGQDSNMTYDDQEKILKKLFP